MPQNFKLPQIPQPKVPQFDRTSPLSPFNPQFAQNLRAQIPVPPVPSAPQMPAFDTTSQFSPFNSQFGANVNSYISSATPPIPSVPSLPQVQRPEASIQPYRSGVRPEEKRRARMGQMEALKRLVQ